MRDGTRPLSLILFSLGAVVVGCGPKPITLTASNTPNAAQTRLASVKRLGLPSFTSNSTVYYSVGYEVRAKVFHLLIDEARQFYEDRFQNRVELSVAVLNRADWEQVAPEQPFGLPCVSEDPQVVLLPATPDGVVVEGAKGLRKSATDATLAKVEHAGHTFEEGALKLIDLIAVHEVGHVATRAAGIRPPSPWSNEFLASYFALAFLLEKHPELANLFVAMTYDLACRDGQTPEYTSLADFDRLYSQVGPANYGWYQGQFLRRAEQVYESHGLGFLEDIRLASSAAMSDDVPANEVLENWEGICPGFIAWGKELR